MTLKASIELAVTLIFCYYKRMDSYTSSTDISTGKVVLLFTGKNCGQCKMLKPGFEKCASESESKARFFEVDTGTSEGFDMAKKYGINALPSIVILENNETTSKLLGPGSANAATLNRTL